MPKGLVKKITRKQARSYERNPLGVTALASVNGRGARGRSKTQRRHTAAALKVLKRRESWRRIVARRAATPNKRKGPPKRVIAVMKKCGGMMKKAWAEVKRGRKKSPKRARRNGAYARRYAVTKAMLKNRRFAKNRSARIHGVPVIDIDETSSASTKFSPLKSRRKKMAGKKRAKAKRSAPKKRAVTRKAARRAAPKAGKRRSTRRRVAKGKRSYGRYKALTAKIGGKKVRTYLYRTKKGGLKKIPRYAVLGFKSEKALQKVLQGPETKRSGALSRRMSAIFRARKRASARVLKMGDALTPNPTVIPYREWSESMKPNRRRKAKKSSRRRSHPKRGGLTKKQRRSLAAKKAARTRAAKHARRSKAAKKAARRRKAKGHTPRKAARRGKRKGARKGYRRNKSSRGRRKAASKRPKTSRRRRPSKKVARRAAKTIARFVANRRRRHHRRNRRGGFRKNQFMAQLKAGLKLGAIVVGGFLAHKALTKVVSDQVLSKVGAFNSSAIAPWKNVIAGALVAAAGIPLAAKVLSPTNAASVGGGIAASFLHGLLVQILTQANQPMVASYLAAYPDAEGRAFPYAGYGEYLPVSGMGAYEMVSGFGGPMLTQAAAGMGGPMLTQAAAGMGGPMLTQAAAGTGEYVVQGASGIGEYEMVSGFGNPEYIDEGIPGGDLAAAERALNISEAAAGIGDLPLQSTVNPLMQTLPVQDAPGGSRSGVLQGRDGIFG